MIKEIDGLKLPPNISGTAELVNRDTTKRTVSGKMITKLAPNEKWKVTVNYNASTLSVSFQTNFYNKCLTMRSASKTIKFISPYDGTEKTITAKCTTRAIPNVIRLTSGMPTLYKDIGAVFEEV